ncbi:MAG: hydrogenase maturation nickel metallochaperone HypA [Clostridiales bacterium]|nr:hydrogenase maturation nickel metallochaperone HypA [Candidatus Coliplasma caballi]
MHELGIVFHVLDTVRDVAKENDVTSVRSVTVEIGEVSTVVPELFEDCWNWAVKKETVCKDAAIRIDVLKAVTYCEDCGKEYPTVEFGKICPHCKSEKTYLLRGNEFNIKEIEAI